MPLSPTDIEALGARAEQMVNALGTISAEPDRLVRLFLTPEHRRAADRVADWMRAAGLVVSEDALGTVRGRLTGTGPKRLLIGSHIDSVIDAGKYDGPFGVIAGILAAEHFSRSGRKLSFGLDVLAFGDEEGSRFPTTLASSSACAGAFRGETLALADRDGVTLGAAITAYGKSVEDIPAAAYAPGEAAAYVEVHIEQGPVLEVRKEPLGVVTAIIGQTYLNVAFAGEAGHAGTVPMALRRDALTGAAECIAAIEQFCRTDQDGLVGTVGYIHATPGATNVIPGQVSFTIDMRAPTDMHRKRAVADVVRQIEAIAGRRQLSLQLDVTHENRTAPCAPWLQEQIAQAIAAEGFRVFELPSGAGHDGMAMIDIADVGMVFVRCRGGISHHPDEHVALADADAGARVLLGVIENFRPLEG